MAGRRRKAAADDARPGPDLFRLQQRLVVRTSNYLRRLGGLAAQGSVEPREYIEEAFDLWSGMLEEVGDWLKPRPQRNPDQAHCPLTVGRIRARAERVDCAFTVPDELFEGYGDDAVLRLWSDGLIRMFDPADPLRAAVTLAPRHNVDVFPSEIRRHERSTPALKLYGIAGLVAPQERYHGLVWGTFRAARGAASAAADRRFPVAALEIEFV